MCSEAIPLQPSYYLQSGLPSQSIWMGRSHRVGQNNYNAAAAPRVDLNQHFRNETYVNAIAASANVGKSTNNHCFAPAHSHRNPQFDNYLAGINANYEVNHHRPRLRDRSSPPDSFNSESSSSDRSGGNPVQNIDHSDTSASAFRPVCRQRSAKHQQSIPNAKPLKKQVVEENRIQENNERFCRSGSQRKTRGYREKRIDDGPGGPVKRPPGHTTRVPVAGAQRQPMPNVLEQKQILPTRDNGAPIRQQRRPNRIPNGPFEQSTKPPQAIDCEIGTRKSRPRRNKRSECFPAKDFNDSTKQTKSFSELYSVQSVIGVGGGGVVYAGSRIADNHLVAVKLVPKEKVKRWEKVKHRMVPQEIALMMRVNNHPGVVKLLDWCENNESFIFVLERPRNSIDLFDYIREKGKLKEKEACKIFKQIVAAVAYIHSKGVVHRDIKDENIVLDRVTGEAKVIDFGCGTLLHDHYYKDFAGTPEFYPPEWFNKRCYRAEPAASWSLGILLYGMIYGEIPFKTKQAIAQAKLQFKDSLSPSVKKLISCLLNKDPESRPSLEEVLNHPWLKGSRNC